MSGDADKVDLRQFEKTEIAGRYRFTRFLDEGAFGAVFAATHMAYGRELRQVAVKIAKRPMGDTEAAEVFADAFKLARLADAAPDAVARSRFVTLHDAGRGAEGGPLAGHPYVVMEFVSGGSLAHALGHWSFPLVRTMAYFDQLLEAVAFMHGGSRGGELRGEPLVHRDIKAGNVLVTRHASGEDSVKLADFGLAIPVDTLMGWVESGGDLSCLGPESFSHDLCSPQTDVYALGLLFFEMLTGQRAFARVGAHLRGSDAEMRGELRRLHLVAREHERFAALGEDAELRKRPALLNVIRRALAFDMNDRFRDAGELRAAWEQAKGGARREERALPRTVVAPAQRVEALTSEAEGHLRESRAAEAEPLLREAERLNAVLPGTLALGRAWSRLVEVLVMLGKKREAWEAANRGFSQRKCRSTLEAMAMAAKANDSKCEHYRKEAQSCLDRS